MVSAGVTKRPIVGSRSQLKPLPAWGENANLSHHSANHLSAMEAALHLPLRK